MREDEPLRANSKEQEASIHKRLVKARGKERVPPIDDEREYDSEWDRDDENFDNSVVENELLYLIVRRRLVSRKYLCIVSRGKANRVITLLDIVATTFGVLSDILAVVAAASRSSSARWGIQVILFTLA
ncbi:hypothetical protein Tco_1556332 [Tanacetum coccineum]